MSNVPDDILNACYSDMRRMARRILAGDGARQLIQPTELANEAAIRLLRSNLSGVSDQGHMLAYAARTMRQVLIDETRKQAAKKREAVGMMTLFPGEDVHRLIDIEDLDRALGELAVHSPDYARVVELRFMLGLSVDETAMATRLSHRTVLRRWNAARLWLLERLGEGSPE
ncbi:ECF-type sigma factor [Novosphingobium cyanobacteriorum]|uniref:ECF-type sigma factor n=1 Tax=Novosphingobium cyanobacteriorum TaxID=3024215 RepID=A0ABT6CMN2_9SPHN|nr:ECF-type sigma factor [Novosphingobium cyanobacteriorum]MDF8335171.1 ECF-type sigma factor [Novosphingobium cyanobacteriorum]